MVILSIVLELLMLVFALYVVFKEKNNMGAYALAFIFHELIKFSLLLLPFVQQALKAPVSIIFFWVGIPMLIGLIHSYKTKSKVGTYLFVLLLIFLMFGASPLWKWLPFVYLLYRFFTTKR